MSTLHSARLEASLDLLRVGVVICDEEGREQFRNQAARELVRPRLGDVLAEGAIAELLEEARAGSTGERHLELFSPTRRDLVVRAYPILSGQRGGGAVAVVEDVSERRRLDAMRQDFVANVSHELKTPVGALSLLAETLDGEDDPEVVARLSNRIALEADRLARIIDDLLDLSRIEADDRPIEDEVEISGVVSEALEPLAPVAELRGIYLEVDGTAVEARVPGNRRDLVSAVGNLVDNAVKYSEAGSTVRVRLVRGAGSVRIEVSDQGIGIPLRDRERIFERFYRVDRARSRLTGGTGLGLAIVRHVAANHGGQVSVRSEEGHGSTFVLDLPARAALGSRVQPAEIAPAGGTIATRGNR